MTTLEFTTAAGALSVHHFRAVERVSTPFAIELWVDSTDASLDLSALVGHPATFRANAGHVHALNLGARVWSGLLTQAEQLRAVQVGGGHTGASGYRFCLVPDLWRLSQRRNNRIFQHETIPDIVEKLLREWSVRHVWHVARSQYPKLEYKVQYAESDQAFVTRLLEEAGIAFTFAADDAGHSVLTLSDGLERGALRPPLPYVDNPNEASEKEFVTRVGFAREVRPGSLAVRDYDPRHPALALLAHATPVGPEARYEQFHYDAGSFLVETGKSGGTPVADDRGVALHDHVYGKALAERMLQGERLGSRSIEFDSNAYDLAPGSVFSMDNHPHDDLHHKLPVLVLETTFEGRSQGEWSLSVIAVPADVPYRTPRRTPKPKVIGVQSATVVGPAGQEIHVDEFGRVRVELPWDRAGHHNERSSCWVRVSQGWGGAGYGTVVLPRIGQEVFLAFLEGDPDQPVITGRAFNAMEQVPYTLPLHKTRSTWKSDSSPGSGGFNEVMVEDLAGKELVWQQAQKDRTRLVKNDEFATVGHDRQKLVKQDESEHTDGERLRWVGKDADGVVKHERRERIEGDSHVAVRGELRELVRGDQSLTVVGDQQERVKGRFALRGRKGVHAVAEDFVGEGAEEVTIAGPGGFLRIDAGGVTISGTLVKINVSGSPGAGRGSKPEEPEEPNALSQSRTAGASGSIDKAPAPKRLPILPSPSFMAAGLVPLASFGAMADPELAIICTQICACKNAHYKQVCVTNALWAADDVSGNRSTVKAEVPYDMSKRPPQPIMSKKNPKRATRRKPKGSRIPDVVIVKNPGDVPTQGNIRKVVEIKFPPDTLSDAQEAAYRRIGGINADFDTLSPEECGCSEPKKKRVPVPVPVPVPMPVPVPVPVPVPLPLPVPVPAPGKKPLPVPKPNPVPQPLTVLEKLEITLLVVGAVALVLDDLLPTGATQADDALLPGIAARLAVLMGRVSWGF